MREQRFDLERLKSDWHTKKWRAAGVVSELQDGIPAAKPGSPEGTKGDEPGMSPTEKSSGSAAVKNDSQSDSSTDSSSESEPSEGDDAAGNEIDNVKKSVLEWFQQDPKGTHAVVHLVAEYRDHRPVPYCRKSPFAQWPTEKG